MATLISCLLALACALQTAAGSEARPGGASHADLAAARALFEANLDAIRRRDRDAYLACYLQSDRLARSGPSGLLLGFDSLAASAGSGWPDGFEALDLRLVPLREGVVYGTYRYRVRYGQDEQTGLSERLFLATAEGWRIAVTSAFPALPGVPPPPRALVGATLVDGNGGRPVRDAVVVMRAGAIECAGPRSRCPVPSGVDTVDVRGHWITPGLVDAHVHYSQTGWVDGRPDALDLRHRYPYEDVQRRLRAHPEVFHRSWLASGVTAVFDVGGYPWTLAMRDRPDTRAPHVVAAGPLLSTRDHWLNLPAERQFIVLADDSTTRAAVRYLKSLGASAVKVWFVANPDRDFDDMARVVALAGKEARQLGLPLVVHATELREAKVALLAGATLLVHSVEDQPVDAEFISLARRTGVSYCPTLVVREGYRRLALSRRDGRAPLVDDPLGVVDSLIIARMATTPAADGERPSPGRTRDPDDPLWSKRARIMAANLVRVHRAGVPIVTGTDAGNPLTLHGPAIYGEMEAMQAAGMSPMDVVVASTRNGGRALGLGERIGTIERGKDADLVVLAADPTRDVRAFRRLRYVVRGGVVRSPAELGARGPARATVGGASSQR